MNMGCQILPLGAGAISPAGAGAGGTEVWVLAEMVSGKKMVSA